LYAVANHAWSSNLSIALAPAPKPNWQGLLSCLLHNRTPDRVYVLERYVEESLKPYIAERFYLVADLKLGDPWYRWKREISIVRFLGMDVVRATVPGLEFPKDTARKTPATAVNQQPGHEIEWQSHSVGPVAGWRDFETYPWPDPARVDLSYLEWLDKNLPDGLCMTVGGCRIFGELYELVGMEHLSYLLYDQPDFVQAVIDKLGQIWLAMSQIFVQFEKLKFIFAGDDMGHRTGTLISPQHLRDLVVPWHRRFARISHEAGRLYLLHNCGQVEGVMPDLVQDVGIDGKHSFEDVIEPVENVYARWGDKTAIIGGIDVDFLCRSDEPAIRRRVRQVLDACWSKGRYCLGSGCNVSDYIPFDNILAMIDEGRRYTGNNG
jgi:uroporphyrinogen decarboxylase